MILNFIANLSLDRIDESVHNTRKRYDQSALEEMAKTIRLQGVITPVLVRPLHIGDGIRYELAAGHRRCRAAKLAGVSVVPAIIRQMDDREFFEVLHLENLHRADIDPLDEAEGYEQLLSQGYDLSRLSHKIGKSITYVASRIRLLQLGTAAREAVRLGYVPVSHAIELAKIADAAQGDVLEELWNLNPEALVRAATGAADAPADQDDDDVAEKTPEDGFDVADTELPLRSSRWRGIASPSLQELKRHLAHEVYRKLTTVPWEITDAALVPEAGACTTCVKRRSAAPLLFAELSDEDDACLDPKCWDAKEDAFVELKRGKIVRAPHQPDDEQEEGDEADVDDKASAAEARREQLKQEQEKRLKERERATAARTAQVKAILRAVPSDALSSVAWLVELFVAVLYEITPDPLSRMLSIMDLDTTPPEGEYAGAVAWKRERLAEWARTPDRSAPQLTRALVLACLGDETVVFSFEQPAGRTPRLQALAALTELDLDAIASTKPEKATRRGKNAAAGDDTDDAPAEPVVKRGRGRPRKVATA
jgi:ParB family chromosome partitioning protein